MEIKTVKTTWSPTDLKHNTYIVENENKAIIIDAGAPLSSIKEVTDADIEAVFITHGHFDHINFIEEYDKLGVPIYMNRKTIDFLTSSEKNVSNLFNVDFDYSANNIHIVKEGDQISVLNSVMEVFETPGHSEDGTTYLIDGNLFTGDTLMSITPGRTDLTTGNAEQLIESLKRIDKINFEKMYGGHGRASTKEEQLTNIPKGIAMLEEKIEELKKI